MFQPLLSSTYHIKHQSSASRISFQPCVPIPRNPVSLEGTTKRFKSLKTTWIPYQEHSQANTVAHSTILSVLRGASINPLSQSPSLINITRELGTEIVCHPRWTCEAHLCPSIKISFARSSPISSLGSLLMALPTLLNSQMPTQKPLICWLDGCTASTSLSRNPNGSKNVARPPTSSYSIPSS